MSPSSRSASSRPSLSSSRSTPPTDVGEASRMSGKNAQKSSAKVKSASLQPPIEMSSGETSGADPENIALPSESKSDTLSEAMRDVNSEIDAIFEQTASESESPMRPPSIPDYQYTGPRNYSSLTGRDSDDEPTGTPSPNPFGPTIRSATVNTAKQVAGDNGMVFPSSVCESPTPSPFISHSRQSSILASRGFKNVAFPEAPILSPFSSQKKKRKAGRTGLSKVMSSPSRKGGRLMEIPVAPSPDPSPLVLLHVTLLPLPPQGPASSVLANHLRKMISPTVVARGLLLPHPNDDYEGLLDMIAENLGLDQETPPPFKKAATYGEEECASHSEGSYLSSSDDEMEPFCPSCSRRRLKPGFQRHSRPRRHRRPFRYNEKWYTVNIFASNGLMRAGAWSRSWEEMERIDVEVTVTPGYEDIEPSKSLRPSSQRSDGKRSLQGSFSYKRRAPPAIVGIDTTTDEEMPKPRRASMNRRRPSGPRSAVGSIRSRNASGYVKQEPLSELELPFGDRATANDIYDEEATTDVPIFEPPKATDTTFVPIWEDKDSKDKEATKPPLERMRSEDAWTTDDEPVKKQDGDENRRLSGITTDTAIHHTIRSSTSRETSLESEAPANEENTEPRKVSNPHRLHPSSRRTSREIKPTEYNHSPDEKTASRPNSSRIPDNMAIVGLAISDESDQILDDVEQDKENHDETAENKENLPFSEDELSSEEDEPAPRNERKSESRSRYRTEDEREDSFRQRPNRRDSKRDFTTRTTGPSPMPSRPSSPEISPDISPITSRAASPQPARNNRKGSRRKSSRSNFDTSFDSRASPPGKGHSRMNSSSTGAPSPAPEDFRGRSASRSPRQSQSPSTSPIREKPAAPENLLNKFKLMIRPAIDQISSVPLPTLLLIAIPFAGLIAFSVNSYVQQRNLDYMVRTFMENQAQAQMNAFEAQKARLDQLQQTTFQPQVIEIQHVEEKPENGQELKPEERAELEWRRAQENGLHTESYVYGIPVGGKCVLPEDVVKTLREATEEKIQNEGNSDTPDSEIPAQAPEDKSKEEEIPFHLLQPEDEEVEERPRTPPSPRMKQQEAPGSPRHQGHQNQRDRSWDRKNVQQQPYDYYQQPPNGGEQQYERDSRSGYDAGDIEVGKMGVRDGGLEDSWFGDVPEMMLPPPAREAAGSNQAPMDDNDEEEFDEEEEAYVEHQKYASRQQQEHHRPHSRSGHSQDQQQQQQQPQPQPQQQQQQQHDHSRPSRGRERQTARQHQPSSRSASRPRPTSRSTSKPRPTSRPSASTNGHNIHESEKHDRHLDNTQQERQEKPKESYVPLNLQSKLSSQVHHQSQEKTTTEQKTEQEPAPTAATHKHGTEEEEEEHHIPSNLMQEEYFFDGKDFDVEDYDY